jgi:hypothetical protein
LVHFEEICLLVGGSDVLNDFLPDLPETVRVAEILDDTVAVGFGCIVGGGYVLAKSVGEDGGTEEGRGGGIVGDSLALCSRGVVCFHGCQVYKIDTSIS